MQCNKNNLSLIRNRIPLADQVEGSEQPQTTINTTMKSPPKQHRNKNLRFILPDDYAKKDSKE